METLRSASGPFRGYSLGPTPPEDDELTHIGPRAPCGEYMRRFWLPFASAGMPCTIFACAEALRRNPALCTEIGERGYDVCAHGFLWAKHYELDEDIERRHIRAAVESIRDSIGTRPLGWYCRYSPSLNTRRLLVEEGGFLYDSDSYADDLPFWVCEGGRPHLVVPYSFLHEQAPVHRLLPAPELRCPGRMPSDVSGPRQSAEVRADHGRRAHAREAAAPRGSLTIVAGTAAGHAASTESTGRLQT